MVVLGGFGGVEAKWIHGGLFGKRTWQCPRGERLKNLKECLVYNLRGCLLVAIALLLMR